jgi:hypothetical protein
LIWVPGRLVWVQGRSIYLVLLFPVAHSAYPVPLRQRVNGSPDDQADWPIVFPGLGYPGAAAFTAAPKCGL